jgi:ABC-type transporter Mla maintaining outer membrane lipid asymmetry ATPase subunit MlaF
MGLTSSADRRSHKREAFSGQENIHHTSDRTTHRGRPIQSEGNLSIPRGQLVAIVGPVGTGKTSLLQGIIGEMRRTSGTVKFGGSVSYCPQSAWIQVCLID